ncbi:hypothetical protein DMH03_17620 [Amycolatopsis sp. WAC 01376]|uniref:hypothetical protein n=1 Tax=Amycolatopsis sp. WAC 01376 TaxID=2203195 RepID=UPI000F7956E0|nr:hypothetical protein [Amycolatopsis sp. WAC 01376]RSM60567.1 hypothetical protein DMH03_17620 [Amycolatopsis sp. WAC 01376]
MPSWHHSCARNLPIRRVLAEDFRALVDNGGEGYERPLTHHELTDFALQDVLHGRARDLIDSWAEIEPTEDYGIRRRYCATDADDPDDFPRVVVLDNWTSVSGAAARKWVTP